MKSFLFTAEGKVFLHQKYVIEKLSTYAIAKERGTYANEIRRALIFHGIPLRDKSEAQAEALESGRHKHPTKGRASSPSNNEGSNNDKEDDSPSDSGCHYSEVGI